jgi:amidase
LIDASGCQRVSHLRQSEASPYDLLSAFETRINKVEDKINPLAAPRFDRGHRALMRRRGGVRCVLAGLPITIKDVSNAAGVRSTLGSRILADFALERSDIGVETIESEGCVIHATSNTPEFGAVANIPAAPSM